MEKILVCVVDGAVSEEKVDELCADVPALAEKLRAALNACDEEKREIMELLSPEISAVNSKNFQVIGMLYKVIHAFQNEHEYPRQVKILCGDDETARMCRVVYNFYIPRTKEERMADSGWD